MPVGATVVVAQKNLERFEVRTQGWRQLRQRRWSVQRYKVNVTDVGADWLLEASAAAMLQLCDPGSMGLRS